jgi:hypothetical protein
MKSSFIVMPKLNNSAKGPTRNRHHVHLILAPYYNRNDFALRNSIKAVKEYAIAARNGLLIVCRGVFGNRSRIPFWLSFSEMALGVERAATT